jgi:hypothetical protein
MQAFRLCQTPTQHTMEREVCGVHYRKSGFMSGFQALAAGAKRAEQPSFLERAKARWGERHGGNDT